MSLETPDAAAAADVATAEAQLAASLAALEARWQRAQRWLEPARLLGRPWVRFGLAVGAGFVLGSLRGRSVGPVARQLLALAGQVAVRQLTPEFT